MRGAFFGQRFKVLGVRFRLILDEVVVECPGVGVGVDGRLGIAEAAAVAEHRFERTVVPVRNVFAKRFEPRVVHAADAAPAAGAGEVGRLEVHGHAFAEPQGDIGVTLLQAAVEGDLVGRFVDDRCDERNSGGLRKHLVDLAHRAMAASRRERPQGR